MLSFFEKNKGELKQKSEDVVSIHDYSIFDDLLEGCMIIGRDWRYVYLNDVAAQHGHAEKEKLIGHTMLEMYPGIEKSKVFEAYARCMQEHTPRRFELPYTFSDGSTNWYEFSVSPITEGIFVLSVDITERKTWEERFKIIFDNTNDGIIVAELESTKFVLVNAAICQMLGYTPEEFITLTIADIHPKESLPHVLEQFGKQIRGELKVAKDLPVKRKDGSIFYVDVNTSNLTMHGKKYALGVFRDITERRNLEIEREQYFKFFEISADIMVIADPNGCFKKVNPACLRILGYPEEELLWKPFIDFVHPDDRQPTLDEMKRQIASGSSLNFENRYMCKDGTVVRLSWRADYDKKEGVTYATARDITDRKEAEAKEKKYLEGLENMNKLMIGRELKMIELKNEVKKLQRNIEHLK